ncbi:MAG: winged helix-turn-helix domain-containing protein, partial [Planctomycetota bacterium]|nr:winged helix-turn-helix domain-containing protein [Planctomycetota bacterium]
MAVRDADGETRLRASQKVAEHLRRNILAGKWRLGERVASEHMLAGQLGVSRVSVRLAIQQFTAIGVLESVHGSGTFL